MALPAFTTSRPLTLGVELELQLINRETRDLQGAGPDMLALLHQRPFPGQVVPEITKPMIEIGTSVHERSSTLHEELRAQRDLLVAAADHLDVDISGGGTHPFQHWTDRQITDKARYRQVSELYGYLAKQFTVFGQHIHVGCTSGDDALYLLHALNRYVPHFIALSASSPFIQGTDTAFESSRLNAVNAFPLSGRAPFLLSWDAFGDYFARIEATGIVRGMKDLYWDLRPKPEFGTIELRVCDTPLTVHHAAALAAYLQVLCGWLLEHRDTGLSEDDYIVYAYNRFQACRFGVEGTLVHPRENTHLTLRDDITATLDMLQPMAQALGAEAQMEHLRSHMRHGGDAAWLRGRHEEGGERVEAMVQAAAGVFRA